MGQLLTFLGLRKEAAPDPSRRRSCLLSEERVDLLRAKTGDLQRLINVTGTILLDKLQEKSVINQEDKQIIEQHGFNDEQVVELLRLLNRKTNDDYEKFCDALNEIGMGGIVRNILLTPSDLDIAVNSLRTFLRRHFTDIYLYSSNREARPVSLHKLFVNMKWEVDADPDTQNYTYNKTEIHRQKNAGDSMISFLKQVQRSSFSRFVVTGEPGAGKTTFVKRICQIWSRHETKNSVVEMYSLSCYVLVIPIILRLIKPNYSLFEILMSQFGNLNALEIHALMKFVEHNPEKVLLVCDGYDELTEPDPIEAILRKSLYPDMKVILTTRPHGITMLRHLGSQAVEGFARIVGFSDAQIKEYINLFYEAKKSPLQGERLYTYLKTVKRYLLGLARIPIRLEMMCIVWSVREDLGEKLVDLYIRFLLYLLNHMEQRIGKRPTLERHIMKKYNGLLLKMAALANSWDNLNRWKTIMSNTYLKECLGDDLYLALDLGCIVMYNPSSHLDEADWMFTHLSLQEFFLAYHLAYTKKDEDIWLYAAKCLTVGKIQKQEVVLSFLCGMNPVRANKILKTAIRSIKDEKDCKHLLPTLKYIAQSYRDNAKLDIPLPYSVDATDESEMNEIQCLFESDLKEHNQNLHTLLVSDITNPVYRSNLVYIRELQLNCDGPVKKECGAVASSMTALTSIVFISNGVQTNLQSQEILHNLPNDKLTHIRFKGMYALNINNNLLADFKNLHFLEISGNNTTIQPKNLSQIVEAVKSCKFLNEVNINVEGLPQALISLESKVKLNLVVEKISDRDISKFVSVMQTNSKKPNIGTLNFSGNDLKSAGDAVGRLLVCLPDIQVVNLGNCNMTAACLWEIERMVTEKANTRLGTKELTLQKNYNMKGSGVQLGKILKHTPELGTLDLYEFGMNDADVRELLTAENTSITKLQLWTQYIQMKDKLSRLFSYCVTLEVLCLNNDGIAGFGSYSMFGSLRNLKVLSFRKYNLSSGRLHNLANNLPPNLEVFGAAHCQMTDIEELTYLISMVSDTIVHLDIQGNKYGSDILELSKMKQQLSKLKKLNIGVMFDSQGRIMTVEDYEHYIVALREELQVDNPDIKVYCEAGEDIWLLYK